MNRRAVLVTMPWDSLTIPSIQLGILKSVLVQAGVDTVVFPFNLLFAEFLDERSRTAGAVPFGVDDYNEVANDFHLAGLGDWIFSVPPFRDLDETRDAKYLAYLREWHASDELIDRVLWTRRQVPDFIEMCAQAVLREAAMVVGFTTTFCQTVASLLLARALKERDPQTTIVFGGANCEGSMGAALHRSFPWVDLVVRGEGEHVFPALVKRILDGEPFEEQPGVCYRQNGRPVVASDCGAKPVVVDEVPIPDFDEYFAAIRNSALSGEVWNRVRIPFESSRGCWWGQKHHCTFCGLNGATMTFRSKTPSRLIGELVALSKRYQRLDFEAVDNILDMRYFKDVLPALRDCEADFHIFYETKANLTQDQVRLLRDAGVRSIQPGIESLNTEILRLMRKGVTALQNIRLLKWCLQFGIRVAWSIIYGFPREPLEAYRDMPDLVPSLTHLPPPYLGRLVIDRFSPYHQRPQEFGIEITGVRPDYPLVYPLDDSTLHDLAYKFDYRLTDGRDPETYVQPLRSAVEQWQGDHQGKPGGMLQYRRGDGFVLVADRRCLLDPADHTLAEPAASIFLRCHSGATPDSILAALRPAFHTLSLDDVRRTLEMFRDMRLVFEEESHFLSLAVPAGSDSTQAASA